MEEKFIPPIHIGLIPVRRARKLFCRVYMVSSALFRASRVRPRSCSSGLTKNLCLSELRQPQRQRQPSQYSSTDAKNGVPVFNSINRTPHNLCFLRHGQSTWNRDNRFIGWTDTPLTPEGVLEARIAGQILRKSGQMFDEVHTSMLRRSIKTTNLVLTEIQQEYLPVHKVRCAR